ncbi:DUF4232 domain-containing protein [Streptomyces sp. NPDC026206]|uniref:DUF4232 domain-containing protein n=1 Tax=Streptomyces sp. NPDC026206 TaxID=3157089 RepID=UPI0033D39C84
MGGTAACLLTRPWEPALRLVNCGGAPRTVNGYPRVRVLGEQGQPLDVAAHNDVNAVARIGGR